jgi:hypothetical protein
MWRRHVEARGRSRAIIDTRLSTTQQCRSLHMGGEAILSNQHGGVEALPAVRDVGEDVVQVPARGDEGE